MANTTNYNWETPDNTDLVKDGALAIRTLGSSIDTTTKALNPSTTLGDIEYRSATANTNTRLGIGSTGNVLTVAGGVPTWAAPAGGGGMTVISSGSLTGGSISIGSITGYNDLQLVLRDYYPGSVAAMDVRVNALNTNEYNFVVYRQDGTSTSNTATSGFRLGDNANGQTNSDGDNAVIFDFYDVQNTTAKKLVNYTFVFKDDGGVNRLTKAHGFLNSTAAISTVVMLPSTGTWGGGTYILYGVK